MVLDLLILMDYDYFVIVMILLMQNEGTFFHDVVDSTEMFLRQFEQLREERVIPTIWVDGTLLCQHAKG